jgi:NAD(P)H-hydrate repair Nnr-like enzyme with NAD(P)H-hydrate dehydratase domain
VSASGKHDRTYETGGLETVARPVEEAMEAIGGTGDTLTGLVSVLIDAGMNMREAAVTAMRANRLAGRYAQPTPATQILEIIRHIPQALQEVLERQVIR